MFMRCAFPLSDDGVMPLLEKVEQRFGPVISVRRPPGSGIIQGVSHCVALGDDMAGPSRGHT
jgi:hypothetical protein